MQSHPDFKKVLNSFKDINLYKYAAYRTALKMQRVQKACKLHLIDLNMISNAFVSKGLEQKNFRLLMTWQETESFLCNLYEAAKRQLGFREEHTSLVRVFMSFLASIFCVESNLALHLYQLKVILALFSAAKLVDKHKYMFQLFGENSFMNRDNLQLLLGCLAKVTESFGEKLTFGTSFVPAAVKSCLQFGGKLDVVSESTFLEWLSYEPQTLVWLSTHYRLSVAERYQHAVKCSICKAYPITGLRYKCLCCFGYNLCQQCFLRGFVNRGHQSQHLIHEFCQPATSWEETKTTVKTLRNKLLPADRLKQNFLEYENEYNMDSVCRRVHKQTAHYRESHVRLSNCVSVVHELSSIIQKLEEENRHISGEIKRLNTDSSNHAALSFLNAKSKLQSWILLRKEALQDHSYHLQFQLQRLHQLLLTLKASVYVSSTPERGIMSPPVKVPVLSSGHFESTPLTAIDKKALPISQNLSKFIRAHAERDGLKNISKTSLSNGTLQGALYSVADIEASDLTYAEHSNHKKRCIAQGNNIDDGLNNDHYSVSVSSDGFYLEQSDNAPSTENCSKFQNEVFSVLSSLAMAKNVFLHNDILHASQHLTPSCNSVSDFTKSSFQNLSWEEKNSVESIDVELQKILESLENLCPKVTGLQSSLPLQKDKFLGALSEMEEALKKLSTSLTDDENFK